MNDDLVKVTVSEGKYTFGQRKDGSCYALRYGEPWREDIFDGLTLAMAHRIEELEAKLAKAVEALEFIDGKISWEINPSNYDHDQVCGMNADWCEIGGCVEATLAELSSTMKGQNQ